MKFLPNFEGFRLTPLFAPIFLTKDVLYLLSHSSNFPPCAPAEDYFDIIC